MAKRVTTIGGGTGHYALLRGLKNYDIDLTAVVSVADNGGSTGMLRTEFGVVAPGDLRNCLVALSDESEIKDLVKLFEHRFPESKTLGKHNLGNLILTALTQQHGNMADALKIASRLLKTKGQVLPVSLDSAHLFARTANGNTLKGEVEVSYPEKGERIAEVWLEPETYVYRESADAIREADLVVICPGDLYGSVIPNFLTKGVNEALAASKAKIAYVCNLVTKQGSYGFGVNDFIREIEKYSGKRLDYVICNTRKPDQQVIDKYKGEASFFVSPDTDSIGKGTTVIKEDLLMELDSGEKRVARHDSDKIAKIILGLI